jgi:peptidoglycan hydrolase CwlO-like protein
MSTLLGTIAIGVTILLATLRAIADLSKKIGEMQTDVKHLIKQVDEIKETVHEVDGEVRQTQTKVAYLDAWLSAKNAPPNGVSTR